MILRAMLSFESGGLLCDFIVKEDKKCTRYNRSNKKLDILWEGGIKPPLPLL